MWRKDKGETMQGIKLNTKGVRATLDGVKTMFREPVKEVSIVGVISMGCVSYHIGRDVGSTVTIEKFIEEHAKYRVGEELFVQEEFVEGIIIENEIPKLDDGENEIPHVWYKATNDIRDGELVDEDGGGADVPWQPASEMTEEQSRLKIRITGRKLEYLQDISIKDALAEGMAFPVGYEDHRECFARTVWQPLNYPPKYQWSANPPVLAYEYEVVS